MNLPNANPTLPSPFDVFRTDPTLDRVERIAKVEAMLRATYGAAHVPVRTTSGEYVLQYFRLEIEATTQRRWAARAIVEREIVEERRREMFDLVARQAHGRVLPTMREVAEAQRAEFEATGEVTTTGYERLDVLTRGVA